jgi:hypothetical protein
VKIFLKLAQKNREADPSSWEEYYGNLILRKIRRRYSASQEFSILRQRDKKPDEFAEYDRYVEECKREVKSSLGIADGI